MSRGSRSGVAVILGKCRGRNGRLWWLQHRTQNAATFAPLQDIVQLGACRENEKFGIKHLMRVFDGFGDSLVL
jgi:hypothetical protein